MQTKDSAVSPRPSRAKAIAFRALAVLLPFAAVLVLEGVLRLAGVGEERRHPFVTIPGHEASVALSPDFGAMFFRGFRPGVAFDPLEAEKSSETLRVVALGGSTTAGFPYNWYYGFPARLEDRLAAMLPGRRVEVANLGMTATNSYTLRALAAPVVEQDPDAVVIYAGHNEFYGAYGTGGTQGWTGTSIPLKRFVIGASRWALVAGLTGGDLEADPGDGRTLMARVVENSAIGLDSEAYRAGLDQYQANLRDALGTFRRAGVPVFLATLTSNLADQAPLGDEPAAAEAFRRGRTLLAEGDTAAARVDLEAAKEADGLRFRAPEAINAIIRRLASEDPNVTLVDVQAQFQAASPGGLEGASLFTDHLHPNAQGYALMADAFVGAMSGLSVLEDALEVGPAPSSVDPVEDGLVRLQLAALMNGYPFRKDRTPEQAEAATRAVVDSLAGSGHPADALAVRALIENLPVQNALDDAARRFRAASDTLAALRTYGGLLYWQPFSQPLMERAVGFALEDAAYDRETAALARYAANHGRSVFSLNALAAVALRQEDFPRADALLAAVEARQPDSPEMLFNRARLLVLEGDTLAARRYFERYRAGSGS